jgi:endonuclease III-like uncharacterized protein
MKLSESVKPISYINEKTQESLAMLKILAQSRKNLEEGKFKPVKESFRGLREKIEKIHKK